jgi:hypothetical protein
MEYYIFGCYGLTRTSRRNMDEMELIEVTVWLLTYLVQLEAVQLCYSPIIFNFS